MDLYKTLDELDIGYRRLDHKAVFTCGDAERENIEGRLEGESCKCLFVKTSHGEYFLICAPAVAKVDLRGISRARGISRLSFTDDEELSSRLGVHPGSVSVFGVINDAAHTAHVLMSNTLRGKTLLLHPNINTSTLAVSEADVARFVKFRGNQYDYF